MRISVGYPERASELDVLKSHERQVPLEGLRAVLDIEAVRTIQRAVSEVRLTDEIRGYVLDIVEATRVSGELMYGVSPRGAIAFCRAAQGRALIDGRDYVVPDDIKELAVPVLAHRVIPKSLGQSNPRAAVEALIERLLGAVAVPG